MNKIGDEIYSRRELNKLYREIPLKDNTFRTLRKYFSAMANLYGVISVGKAWEIIAEQSPKLVTEEEYLAFAEVARHECEGYQLLGAESVPMMEREIVDRVLLEQGLDAFRTMTQHHQGKDCYVPKKTELLAYEQADHVEETAEAAALEELLQTRFHLEETAVVMGEVAQLARRLPVHPAEAAERVKALGVSFQSEEDVAAFVKAYEAYCASARSQVLFGHNQAECPEEQKPVAAPAPQQKAESGLVNSAMDPNALFQAIWSMDLPSEELRMSMLTELAETVARNRHQAQLAKKPKVGRNDPCPCGSGKKYKKCCGR